ncbi:MAG: hypothetical protein ACOYBY_13365 [Dermatophilaceae bacterium]
MAERGEVIAAFVAGRARGDAAAMAEAALELAAHHSFGTHLGSTPAYVHEAYVLAEGARRARLAAALARTWVYGNERDRAVPFAAEAEALAASLADQGLLAEALDAALLVHWGPDDQAERLRITTRLDDIVAHLSDVEARLSAHLWRLTAAVEHLDPLTAQRQIGALVALAEESGSARVRFFATSRRAMWALVVGDVDAVPGLVAETVAAGQQAGESDTDALRHELVTNRARQTGDIDELARQAELYEQFGAAQGIPSIVAEGATHWLAAGHPERARALVDRLGGSGLGAIPRDHDWLLTICMLAEAASGTGAVDVAERAATLLTPYAGRGVSNAGAVVFMGVVDDYLRMACMALGRDEDAAQWAHRAAACYQRLGATWWLRRLALPAPTSATQALLVAGPDGIWSIGRDGHMSVVREMKGFHYLAALLRRPNVDVAALDLSAAASGGAVEESSTGEVIDRQALAAYRARLRDLSGELASAQALGDAGRVDRLVDEREFLLAEVASATGLAGRSRRRGGSAERARVAVQKSIATAIKRVGEVDPTLGRLLRDTVRTGAACRYDPDPARPVDWVLTKERAPGQAARQPSTRSVRQVARDGG